MKRIDVSEIKQKLGSRKTATQQKMEDLRNRKFDADAIIAADPLLHDLKFTGYEDDLVKQLKIAGHKFRKSGCLSLKPLLPLLLQLKGQPYHLNDHFPFEPLFRTRIPKSTVLKTGRQTSKSTSLAAQGVLFANCINNFTTLYVLPLFEQARRFAQNYVRSFIDTSPVRKFMTGTNTVNSVFQKSFKNRSQLMFSYAYLSADRVRGLSTDVINYDEVQDIDISFIPIIQETMSASSWGLNKFTGTPKTLDGTLERIWQDSSMAEWLMKCDHCNFWNVPSADYHLLDMLGPWHPDISEECPGIVCAKCQRPINPRFGRWVHRRPELRFVSAGYHIAQPLMPMHYASSEKWAVLKGKQAGKGSTTQAVFYNEVLGESFDAGSKLVTVTDLRAAASLPWPCDINAATKRIYEYDYRVIAVDWGGGGVDSKGNSDEKFRSYTCVAVMGILPDGQINVLWGKRLLTPHQHRYEADFIKMTMEKFKAAYVIHDYTGAGSRQETIMVESGVPVANILPVQMIGAHKGDMFHWKDGTELHSRGVYLCDKPRSLGFTCQLIKSGVLRFFQYDHKGHDDPGLLHDFLNLIEDKSNRGGRETYRILKSTSGPDDFAQAVNLGVMAVCQISKRWHALREYEDLTISAELVDTIYNPTHSDWEEI